MPKESKFKEWLGKIRGKSAYGNSYNTSSLGSFGGIIRAIGNSGVHKDTTPKGLVEHSNNYIYACTQKISQYISSVPIHAYYSANQPPTITRHKNIDKNLTNTHKLNNKINVKNENIYEITDKEHPIVEFLNSPAPQMSWSDWISLCASYLTITGNFLCEIITDGEKVLGLQPLQWEHIEVVIDRQTGKISQYKYTPHDQVPVTYDPEAVIHIVKRYPGNITTGKGAMEACIGSSTLFEYFDNFQIALSNNYGRPSFHINAKVSQNNKEQATELAKEWQRKYTLDNVGTPVITFGDDVQITELSMNPKDMEYSAGRESCKKTISAVLGVPIDLLDSSNSNRATSVVALNSFYNVTIFPLLSSILEAINTEFIEKYYDQDAYVYYDPNESLKQDPVQQASVLNGYVSSGIMTVNEAREVLGMEPLKDDNVPSTSRPEAPEGRSEPVTSPSTDPPKEPKGEGVIVENVEVVREGDEDR